MRLPSDIRRTLDATGLPWVIERGTRHRKIVLAGHFVGILPHSLPGTRTHDRSHRNVIAQIKRVARQHKEP